MDDDVRGCMHYNLGLLNETVQQAVPDQEAFASPTLRLTHAQLAERSRRLASYLHSRGLGAKVPRTDLAGHQSGQDHVAIYLYNGNQYLEGMLGAFKARVAPFNVNYRYVREELAYLLRDADTRGIIYHAAFAPILATVLGDLPGIEVLIQVADGSGNELLPGAVDYEETLSASDPAGPPVSPAPDDLYILYTGGTTGMPKGVLWRQHDIFVAAMGGRPLGSVDVVADYETVAERASNGGSMRFLILPPLMHGAAQWIAFMTLLSGGTVVFPEDTRRLVPSDVWSTIGRERVIALSVVGDAMVRPLVDELEHSEYDLGSLVTMVSGGAPLNPSLKERVTNSLPNLIIADAAGSSETGAQMSQVSSKGSIAGRQFAPGPGTVVLSESLDHILAPGHAELGWLAQSGHLPLGYL
ncbi:MAG: AMP-binding protein, partial [Acidimicrobiales bacterium]